MSKLSQGRKPVSSKGKSIFSPANFLAIPDSIKEELESKGLVCRWINYKKFVDMGGYHKNHWEPYKVDYAKLGIDGSLLGKESSGLFRRGDNILAVRSKDVNDAHKEYLQDKAAAQTKAVARHGVEELKEMARGIKSRVVEGYDD